MKQRVTLCITLIYLVRFQPGSYWAKAGIASGHISLVVDTRCRPIRPHYEMVSLIGMWIYGVHNNLGARPSPCTGPFQNFEMATIQ